MLGESRTGTHRELTINAWNSDSLGRSQRSLYLFSPTDRQIIRRKPSHWALEEANCVRQRGSWFMAIDAGQNITKTKCPPTVREIWRQVYAMTGSLFSGICKSHHIHYSLCMTRAAVHGLICTSSFNTHSLNILRL